MKEVFFLFVGFVSEGGGVGRDGRGWISYELQGIFVSQKKNSRIGNFELNFDLQESCSIFKSFLCVS